MLQAASDPQLEWLYHVGPTGLVIGPNIIRAEDLTAPPQTAVDNAAVAGLVDPDPDAPALADPWTFFESVLGWKAAYVAGAPGGPPLPDNLAVRVGEHDVALMPDWAVRDLDTGSFQLLVQLRPELDAERAGPADGWSASARLQFERLLIGAQVPIGVLVDRAHIIVVYVPSGGGSSGHLKFPLRSLATVAGRAMLGGLKLMLGHARLFTEPTPRRLPALLARSREAQNEVSTALAAQVLGALHELLRAFHAADPDRIERLATERPQHLYRACSPPCSASSSCSTPRTATCCLRSARAKAGPSTTRAIPCAGST